MASILQSSILQSSSRFLPALRLEGPDNRHDYGEQRIGAYGLAENEVLFVIYTWGGKHPPYH